MFFWACNRRWWLGSPFTRTSPSFCNGWRRAFGFVKKMWKRGTRKDQWEGNRRGFQPLSSLCNFLSGNKTKDIRFNHRFNFHVFFLMSVLNSVVLNFKPSKKGLFQGTTVSSVFKVIRGVKSLKTWSSTPKAAPSEGHPWRPVWQFLVFLERSPHEPNI